jgi:hypothetical protein
VSDQTGHATTGVARGSIPGGFLTLLAARVGGCRSTDPAIGQLLTAAQALCGDRARLLPVLAAVPDPRARRGVRHRLAVILGLAGCTVRADARSFTVIAEIPADADQGARDALGVTGVVPCESAFRRTLQSLDDDALDEAAGAWARERTASARGARRVIAVDGKTLRGQAWPAVLGGIFWIEGR